MEIFSCIYKSFIIKKRIRVKLKNLMYPCVTKGIEKSSEKKQGLYTKYQDNTGKIKLKVLWAQNPIYGTMFCCVVN